MGNTLAMEVSITEADAMPWPTLTMNDSRKDFVRRAMARDCNFAQLCKEFGISRKTGYKWLTRCREDGLNGVRERSRRPKQCPTQLSEDVVCELGKLKLAHPRWGPVKVRLLYRRLHGEAPSISSCQRILQKLGLVVKRRRRVRRTHTQLAALTVATRPNHVWTTDFKGWWTVASGERCEPLTVCDAYSRFVLATVLPTSTGYEAVKKVFIQLFEQYGLPEIIRSDNGSPFASVHAPLGLSRLSAWWISLGIMVVRGRPGHPEDNPSHERMHGDLEAEISSYVQPDRAAQQAALDLWRRDYNTVRPHEALKERCPADLYYRSDRRYSEAELDYGSGFLVRKVSSIGSISWRKQRVFISCALAGPTVGLRRTVDQHYEVWLHHLFLGIFDAQTYGFRVAPSRDPEPACLSA